MAEGQDPLRSLHPGLQRWVMQQGEWSDLTPIQRAAIPVILAGEDCIVEAPTAGGKTEAVLFPVLTRAARLRRSGRSSSVRVLYLAPLKALLNNLQQRGQRYAEACGLTAFKWHGDVGQQEKSDAFRDPPTLLMTTPESLEAMLLRRADWQQVFAGLTTVVLDEAHNFAAGDRGGHLLCLLERIQTAVTVGPPPQRIAMSATVGNPNEMLHWLAGRSRTPGRRVHIGALPREDRDYRLLFFSDAGEDENTLVQERADYRRFAALYALLRGDADPHTRSLVFVRSRRGAEGLANGFAELRANTPTGQHIEVRTHHSAVSKFFREAAEQLIQIASEGGIDAIISTSTLELGIDIGALDRVVQMNTLASPSSFLQRVGRTGRRPGKPPFFRGLLMDEDDLPVLTATMNLGFQGHSEALLLPTRAFHLLAHQVLCLCLQSFGAEPSRLWETVRGAYCFAAVTREEFDRLVEHMVESGYLRRVDSVLVVGPETEDRFLHSNWRRLFAVFDTAPLYEVHHGRQQVGTLDVSFVESLEAPFFFVLGGKLWRANRIDTRRRHVQATPSKTGDAPRWRTFGGPDVPYETAQEAGRLLHKKTLPDFLDSEARETFRALQQRLSQDGWRPGEIVLRTRGGGFADLITYAGDRINRTLARFLDLDGVGNATANYREVNLTQGGDDPTVLEEQVHRSLERLRNGDYSNPRTLSRVLEAQQKLYPFSPFARCLPPSLWAAALIERNLDPHGLLTLLGHQQ